MANRLVIEWTRTMMRLAVATRRGRPPHLVEVHSHPLGATLGAAAALQALLKAVKSPFDHVIGVIPREQVITRVVKFPTTQAAELSQMIELYAKAQLPYAREQTMVDFHLVRQQEGFSTVAIVACQREVVDRHLAILHEAGLAVGLLTVSSWGVLGWFQRLRHRDGAGVRSIGPGSTGGSSGSGGTAEEPTLVINVDETRTDLVLIAEGRILSSRSVGQGAQEWGSSGEILELLAQEVERSRVAVRKELPATEVRSLVVTGVSASSQWAASLTQQLGLPASAIDMRQPFPEWKAPEALPGSSVVVAGAACSDPRQLLNLNPPELRVQVRHRQQVRDLVTTSFLLMAIIASGAGMLGLEIVRQQRQARQLDQLLADIEPTARQIRDHSRTVNLVGSFLDHRRQLATTLAGVLRNTPATVSLEGVTYERARGELVLRGSTASNQEVLDYKKQLEQLTDVRAVHLKYLTRRAMPTGERTDFELVLNPQEAS